VAVRWRHRPGPPVGVGGGALPGDRPVSRRVRISYVHNARLAILGRHDKDRAIGTSPIRLILAWLLRSHDRERGHRSGGGPFNLSSRKGSGWRRSQSNPFLDAAAGGGRGGSRRETAGGTHALAFTRGLFFFNCLSAAAAPPSERFALRIGLALLLLPPLAAAAAAAAAAVLPCSRLKIKIQTDTELRHDRRRLDVLVRCLGGWAGRARTTHTEWSARSIRFTSRAWANIRRCFRR
jgi:hypothetical protein